MRAQLSVPAAIRPIPTQTLPLGGTGATIDLPTYLALPGVTGQVVQFDTVLGKFNVELLANDAPQSVANFLSYVDGSAYGGTIIHRALALDPPGSRIVQGGGYDLVGTAIARKPSIPLEYKLPNIRGTLAMARTQDANSATSEWFFNVDDNTDVLGANNNGGFAVFARVIGSGMSVVEAISAVQSYNAGGVFTAIPLRDIQPGQTNILPQNLIIVNSVSRLPTYPTSSSTASVVTYSVLSNSSSSTTTATISGSTLRLAPSALGTSVVTIRATDTDGNTADVAIQVAVAPRFTTQPTSQSRGVGETVTLIAAATGATSYQWQQNGRDIAGATNATLTLPNLQPSDAGVYAAIAAGGGGAGSSLPAVIGVLTTSKVVGAGTEVAANIPHPNGNVYDQVLLQGSAATVTSDNGQVTRISYVDLTDDIVQVEFSGPGSLSLVLGNASGPATPLKYNQPTVTYMKGHATIVIAGATENTHMSVFSVGRANAVNQALFRDDVAYDGMADVATVAIASSNGKFGGARTSNASYTGTGGFVGVYAPGVEFTGPVFVGDIAAADSATPVLLLGNAADVRITGGDLLQTNNRAVLVDGFARLQMAAGTTSHGNPQPAQPLRGRLERSGVDVTAELAN
jgi:cyclophilin family peptidyl-prolyl cis-trans isomerase